MTACTERTHSWDVCVADGEPDYRADGEPDDCCAHGQPGR